MSRDDFRTSRRSVVGASGAVGIASLAGCLGVLGPDDDGPAGDDGVGGDGTPGDGTGTDDDAETLTAWHAMGGDSGDFLDELVEGYDGADWESEYQGSYEEVLNNTFGAIQAGAMPDVVQIDSLHAQQILDTGAVRPAEAVLPDDYPVDDLVSAVRDFFLIDGDLNSMPFNNSNAVMYYNRDMFEEAGLDPDDPPETIEEVREYSEAIVDAGVAEAGITWPNHVWFVEHFYALADQLIVDQENGHAGAPTTIHTEVDLAEELWSWWREMYEEGYFLNSGIEAWGEARSAFLSGEVAMELDSTAAVAGHVESAEEQGFELGTAYHPSVTSDRTGVPIGGASFYVRDDVDDDRAERIGETLAHLGSVEHQKEWHKTSGYYPIRETAIDELEEEGWFEENPQFRTAFDQMLESETTPATLRMLLGPAREVQLTVQEVSVEIFSGEVGVEAGLERMKSRVEEELERYDRVSGN